MVPNSKILYYEIFTLLKSIPVLLAGCFSVVSFIGTILSHLCVPEELLAKLPAIRAGSPVAGISRERFVDRLTWLRQIIRFNMFNFREKQTFFNLSKALEQLKLDDSNGSVRMQPYCVFITGYPGCGKSNFALEIATECLKARYGSAKCSDIVTLNETDEFQSEFRTNHKVVIFDDLGAEIEKPSSSNPWRKVIDFVNNIRKTSLNPNVEMKGNVYIEPDLVIITSNMQGSLCLDRWLKAPEAIVRRMKKVLYLDSGRTIVKEFKPSLKSEDSHAYNRLHYQLHHSKAQTFTRSDIIKELVYDFTCHISEQETYVVKTNAMLSLNEEKGFFRSFYDDVIKPWRPVVPIFSKYTLDSMSYFERIYYDKICVKEDIPTCQTGDLQPRAKSDVLEPQAGLDEIAPTDIVQFLLYFVDWEWFSLQVKGIKNLESCHFELWTDCFRVYQNGSSDLYAKNLLTYKPHDCIPGMYAKGTDILKAYELHISTVEKSKEKDFSTNLLQAPLGEIEVLGSFEQEDISQEMFDEDKYSEISEINSEVSCEPKIEITGYNSISTFERSLFVDYPLRQELLATLPGAFKVSLDEWVHPQGVGDFVFCMKCRKNYHFLVTEVKHFYHPRSQLVKAVTEFDRHLRSKYKHNDCIVMSLAITSRNYFIPRYFSGERNEMVEYTFANYCAQWQTKFQALRCANQDLSVDPGDTSSSFK